MELQIRVKNIRPQGCGGVIQLSRAPQTGAEVLSKVQSPRLDLSHPLSSRPRHRQLPRQTRRQIMARWKNML